MENNAERKLPTARELFARKQQAVLANKIRVDRAKRKAGPDAMVVYHHASEKIDEVSEKLQWAEGDEVVASIRTLSKRKMKKAFKQARAILLAQGFATSVVVKEDGPDNIVSLVYHHRPYV